MEDVGGWVRLPWLRDTTGIRNSYPEIAQSKLVHNSVNLIRVRGFLALAYKNTSKLSGCFWLLLKHEWLNLYCIPLAWIAYSSPVLSLHLTRHVIYDVRGYLPILTSQGERCTVEWNNQLHVIEGELFSIADDLDSKMTWPWHTYHNYSFNTFPPSTNIPQHKS